MATGGGGGKGVEEGKEKKSVTFGGGPDTPVEGAEKAGEKEEEEKKEEEMELDEAEGEEATNKKGSEEKGKEAKDAKVEGKEEGGGRGPEEKKKEEPEADFEMLSNPTRVLQQQVMVALISMALLTLVMLARSKGYCSCPVCVGVCVSTHVCRLTHWNHKTEIPTGSQQYSDCF